MKDNLCYVNKTPRYLLPEVLGMADSWLRLGNTYLILVGDESLIVEVVGDE